MAITPGSHIGPYEVISQLGEGGMGVVFRGRDAILQRDVALKVLPDNFAGDPDRLSRFQREAQTLASLNHSNIAQIYGLEQANGSTCIVMELVEGETLEDRIKKGPFSYDEALDIAKQIADALAAAHERGIVHRDLKPANIKVMPNGTVKVLDFGLAKALGPKTSDTSLTAMPTMASGSMVGVIVGTPGYMSPEQARGKEVDARTDIWAFGCVLYEMLTAQQAFGGETITDIMAKIVTSAPDLDLLPKDTPSSVRLLLSSALNKNATQRLQHIGDTRLFLDGSLTPAIPATAEVAGRSSTKGKFAIAVLAIAFVAAAIPAALYFRGASETKTQMRFDIAAPGFPDVSPDGLTLAYAASTPEGKRMLWARPIGSEIGQQLAGTEGVSGFMWSPDSKRIVFIADSKLKKVDLAGSAPQILGNASNNTRGADWNGNGTILIARVSDNVIVQLPDGGGESTPATKLDASRQETVHGLPAFLPDKKHFLYVAVGTKQDEAGIFRASLDPNEAPTRIVKLFPNQFNGMAFVPPNRLLYSNNRRLFLQSMDAAGTTAIGDPTTIADEITGNFSVSDNGLLIYQKLAPTTLKRLLWFSHDGKPGGQLGAEGNYGNLDLSPKGDRVAVDLTTDNRDIWVIDVDRAVPQRVTFDPGPDWSATWSPDGARLMFATSRADYKGVNKILEKSSTGAGMETLVQTDDSASIPVHWSPTGNHLIYARMRSTGNGYDSWLLPLTGERKATPFLEGAFDRIQARISPDGRFVAYTTNESGMFQIVVQTFPDPNGGKWTITADGGVEPKWRRDGRELYYLALDGKLMAVPISGPAFNAGKPTVLFQTPLTVNRGNPTRDRRYDITPDGRFLMVVPAATGAPIPFTIVVNWDAALDKK
jgi:Tol biopolymer transport system component/predicted Ser/Thr protein kinase